MHKGGESAVNRLIDKAVPYAAVSLLAFLACITLALRGGWPYNHDGNSVFVMGHVFGDLVTRYHEFFPAWTAYGNYGLGSPMPFFYHHLYYYLITFLNLFFNDILISVKFSIFLLLSLGGTAVYLTISKLFRDRFYGIIGAGLFIFSTYIYTQWLIRGAFSEFLASIIFLWLLYILLRISFNFSAANFLTAGFLFALLLYAHSLIFMFSLFAFVIFLIVNLPEWIKNPVKPLFSSLFPIILGLPFVMAYFAVRDLFDLDYTIRAFQVKDNFIEIYRYFFDNHYNMGEAWQDYSVEIGRFFILPLIIMISVILIRKRSLLPGGPGFTDSRLRKYIVFIIAAFAFYLILQFPFTLPFYNGFIFLKYVQFPWRLLCLITPLSIIIFIYYSNALIPLFTRPDGVKIVKIGLAAVLFIQVIWVGGNFEFYKYKSFTREELQNNMAVINLKNYCNRDEYFPKGFKKKEVSSTLENKGLSIISSSDPDLLYSIREFDTIHISLAPGGGGELVFNQLRSPFITLKFSSNINVSTGEYQETVFHQVNDGRTASIDISKKDIFGLDGCFFKKSLGEPSK